MNSADAYHKLDKHILHGRLGAELKLTRLSFELPMLVCFTNDSEVRATFCTS